jgi:hypothetical protein
MSDDKIAEIRARHESPGVMLPMEALGRSIEDRATLLAEIERLTRDRDEARAEVERLRERLRWYAHQYCELGEAVEGCGKLTGDQCGGCLARAALEAKS